jgi:hypothetical protein
MHPLAVQMSVRLSDALLVCAGGSTAKMEELTRSIKEERARVRQLEQQLETTSEELREV